MVAPPVKTQTTCYHCGQPVGATGVHDGEHSFCCEGCHTVYNLLEKSGLCAYYNYADTPGTQEARQANRIPELAYLEDPQLARQLVDYADETLGVVTFKIPGIHCTSCLWLLEQLHNLDDRVLASEVNLSEKTVHIRFRWDTLGLRGLVELLHRIGYPPILETTAKDTESARRSPAARRLVSQIGMAGFALGNIMLLAFPDYLEPGTVEGNLQRAFSWVSLGLSLLAVYAARDYFIRARQGITMARFAIEQPLALGITAMLGVSSYEIATTTGTGYLDSLAGLVFFLLVGKWLQQRTFDRLQFDRDYRSLFPLGVTAILDSGEEKTVALQSVVPGRRLVLRSGELVPVDAHLLSEEATFDYSFLTGESTPVTRTAGELLYAGGRVLSGRTEILSATEASASRLARLWDQPKHDKTQQATDYTQTVNQLAQIFTAVVVTLAIGTLAYWLPRNPSIAWLASTGLLIIACPCALSFAAPFAFGTLQQWLGSKGIFLRRSAVVEALARTTDIVVDKTGTLTEPELTSASFVPAHGELTQTEATVAASLASQSAHPLSRAIAHSLQTAIPLQNFEETTGKGLAAHYQGIEYRLGHKNFVAPCRCENKCKALKAIEQEPDETRVHLSIDGKYRGYYRLHASYLPGIEKALQQLAEAGYVLHLLSGDGPGDRARLEPFFPKGNLHFGQTPEDKLAYIKALQAAGKRVAYFGDGLNDAAALAQSEVGIAVTGSTALFTPASDAILLRTEMTQLPRYMRLSQQAISVVKTTFSISLIYNVIGATFAVQGLLAPVLAAILMPLISIGSMAIATGLMRLMINRSDVSKTHALNLSNPKPALA